MRRALLPAFSLALVLAGTGCDFLNSTVPQDWLEGNLEEWLKDHDMEAHDIHCPDGEPWKKDHTFECTCQVHGTDIPVTVTVTDPGTRAVAWEPKYVTLKREDMEKEIETNPNLAEHDLELDCHEKVWVSIPDSVWTCDVTDKSDGKKYLATVTFTDGNGMHNIKFDEK